MDSRLLWKLSADAVLAVHILWLSAVVLGPLGACPWPRFRLPHLLLMGITVALAWAGFYCPLTTLESALRFHFNASSPYAEGFVADHLNRLASWDVEQREVDAAVTAWALLWAGVYFILGRRKRSPA